jgi:hypothetical protein
MRGKSGFDPTVQRQRSNQFGGRRLAGGRKSGHCFFPGRTRRKRNEQGATIVEFAIVSIAFFALVLGIIDFSMAMFEMNGVNFGTRSQARSASNGEWGSSLTCNLSPQGTLDPDIQDLMCSTKLKTSVASERVRVRIRYEDPDFPTRVDDVKPQKGKSLVVCTMTNIRSVSGVFGPLVKDKVITSIARSRIERDLSVEWKISGVPNETKGPLLTGVSSENPLPGADWNFCIPTTVGNTDVGTDTVAESLETCAVTWLDSGQTTVDGSAYAPGDNVSFYILDGDVTNLTRDPWGAYEVKFGLPRGHIPRLDSNRAGLGRILPGPFDSDPLLGLDRWVFRKVGARRIAQPDGTLLAVDSDYGLPLEDGDLQPGNGISISVEVPDDVLVDKTVPTDNFHAEVRIPPAVAPAPLDPSDPFGTEAFEPCRANS